MEYDNKLKHMGRAATALLNLHLQDPKKFDAETIISKLFDKFEELDLEEDFDQKEIDKEVT